MGDATETRGDLRPAGSGQLYGSPRRRSTRGRNRRGELRMPDADPAGRSPLRFFLLVFLLTVPFLVLGALNDGQIVPGVPLAGLAVVCPVLAGPLVAMIMTGTAVVVTVVWGPRTLARAGHRAERVP